MTTKSFQICNYYTLENLTMSATISEDKPDLYKKTSFTIDSILRKNANVCTTNTNNGSVSQKIPVLNNTNNNIFHDQMKDSYGKYDLNDHVSKSSGNITGSYLKDKKVTSEANAKDMISIKYPKEINSRKNSFKGSKDAVDNPQNFNTQTLLLNIKPQNYDGSNFSINSYKSYINDSDRYIKMENNKQQVTEMLQDYIFSQTNTNGATALILAATQNSLPHDSSLLTKSIIKRSCDFPSNIDNEIIDKSQSTVDLKPYQSTKATNSNVQNCFAELIASKNQKINEGFHNYQINNGFINYNPFFSLSSGNFKN